MCQKSSSARAYTCQLFGQWRRSDISAREVAFSIRSECIRCQFLSPYIMSQMAALQEVTCSASIDNTTTSIFCPRPSHCNIPQSNLQSIATHYALFYSLGSFLPITYLFGSFCSSAPIPLIQALYKLCYRQSMLGKL
jgi:hypothetical protein